MAERTRIAYSNSVTRGKEKVTVVGAATTLTPGDSGGTFVLSTSGTDGAAITLPAVEAGLEYRFIVGAAFATTDWTIVAASNVIEGYAAVNYATIAAVNENTISFVATAETIGDQIELLSDGTSWLVSGTGNTVGSITFTAP